jgi:hypothetical protein
MKKIPIAYKMKGASKIHTGRKSLPRHQKIIAFLIVNVLCVPLPLWTAITRLALKGPITFLQICQLCSDGALFFIATSIAFSSFMQYLLEVIEKKRELKYFNTIFGILTVSGIFFLTLSVYYKVVTTPNPDSNLLQLSMKWQIAAIGVAIIYALAVIITEPSIMFVIQTRSTINFKAIIFSIFRIFKIIFIAIISRMFKKIKNV